MQPPELKRYSFTISNEPVTVSEAFISPCDTIYKGTGQSDRIGDEILLKSIQLNLLFVPAAAWYFQEVLTIGRLPIINIVVLNVREPQALTSSGSVDMFGRWQLDRSLFVTPGLTFTNGSPLSSYPFMNNSLVKSVNILKHIRIPLHRYLLQQGQTTSNVGTDSSYKYLMRQFVRTIRIKFRRGVRVKYSLNTGSDTIMTNDVCLAVYVDCVVNNGGTNDVVMYTDCVVRYQDA